MMLLSICIPTYNRPDELKELYRSILRPALDEYGERIEVIVRDNSDENNALLNQAILGDSISYYKNETNIGFWGSQLKLVEDATGNYIWIISDDDLILWDGFRRLMDCLPRANDEGIDCIVLPINYRTNRGELLAYDGSKKDDVDLATYVKNLPSVPFGYFAASVIRLNKKPLDWIAKEFKGNEIINIPLFLSMLKPVSKLRFLDKPVLEYHELYYVRGFYIPKFYLWLHQIIAFLEKEYDVNGLRHRAHSYTELQVMVITHRVGLRLYPKVNEARWYLLAKFSKNITLRSLILIIMIFLPHFILKPLYLLYLSFQHSLQKKNFSIREVISRYKILDEFIHSKQNERRTIT